MIYNFCTLFAVNYLHKGLALHSSLLKYCQDFKLWILCMDNKVYEVLKDMNLDNVILITIEEFEDDQLLNVKKNRSLGEYCWTCFPALPLYLLKKDPEIDVITYLDADTYLYSSPNSILKEIEGSSVLITKQNFSSDKTFLEKTHGIYNTGIFSVRRDKNSIKFLIWWKKKCLEWCFATRKEGLYGDQGHLNDVVKRFSGICVSKQKGLHLANWNISNYRIKSVKDKIMVDNDPLIFYHFADLKVGRFDFSNKNKQKDNIIYYPYIKMLRSKIKTINQYRLDNYDFTIIEEFTEEILNTLRRMLRRTKLVIRKVPFLHPVYGYFKKRKIPFLNERSVLVKGASVIKLSCISGYKKGGFVKEQLRRDVHFEVKSVDFKSVKKTYSELGNCARTGSKQVIVCLKGSFVLTLNDGSQINKVVLNNPNLGVVIDKFVWYFLSNFEQNSSILLLSDQQENRNDYLTDYGDFLRYVRSYYE